MTPVDIDVLVARADPAPAEDSPLGTSATARSTYRQITDATAPPWRRPAARRRRMPVAIAAGALAVATLVAVLVGTVGKTSAPDSHAAATAVLERAAVMTAAASPSRLELGQYLYQETKSLDQVSIFKTAPATAAHPSSVVAVASARYRETEQAWADAAGVGHGELTRGALRFSSPADRAAWEASPPGRQFSSDFAPTVSEPSLQQVVPNVSALSTNPSVLAGQIAHRSDGARVAPATNGPSAVFQRAARLLVGPDVGMTPALAAALYRVLATQPNTALRGTATDHLGRDGVAVSSSNASGVSEVIFNPHTGVVLEVRFTTHASKPTTSRRRASVTCEGASGCASSTTPLVPGGFAVVVRPLWTDTVSSVVVNSSRSTRPVSASPTS